MIDSRSTTILALRYRGKTVFAGDGQVTINNTVMKHGATKIRSINEGRIKTGFAGSAADALTLFERFDAKVGEARGQLGRAVVELAKDWRTDKFLRKLEAMMIVGSSEELYLLSGAGDVIEPDDDILAIGSGGNFALAAARALVQAEVDLPAEEIARRAMKIAAHICPFTNDNLAIEEVSA